MVLYVVSAVHIYRKKGDLWDHHYQCMNISYNSSVLSFVDNICLLKF